LKKSKTFEMGKRMKKNTPEIGNGYNTEGKIRTFGRFKHFFFTAN
jgi:hypothetical protein